MNITLPLFHMAMPEIFLLSVLSVVLLVDIFLPIRFKFLTYLFAQASVMMTFILVVMQYSKHPDVTTTFNGAYVLDRLAVLTKIFILVTTFFAFIYARDYLKKRNIPRSEYYILGLLCVLGMQIMASAYSFLTIYLGLELMSLSLYAMVALDKSSIRATEAAMKFFIMGALASGLLLYGISMVYGATQTINIAQLGEIVNQATHQQNVVVLFGLVFILVGLLFKFGVVPFHMWVPDVYDGAPTSVTLFIASAPKMAAFCVTMRVLVEGLSALQIEWQFMLICVAVLSMLGGNLLAIAQTNIKRMLAYSSIAHMGYALLGIIAGPDSTNGYSSAMFYIGTYVVIAAGAFAVISIMSHESVELDQLEDYRGLNARNPWLAFIMLLLMFSMAGIPPTVGFFAKLGLLEALVEANYVWLAAFALVFAIIGAYYYLRIVMYMYFEEPRKELRDVKVKIDAGVLAAISLNGMVALGFGLLPSSLIDMCRLSMV